MVFFDETATIDPRAWEKLTQQRQTLLRMTAEGKRVYCIERGVVRRTLTRGDALEAGFPSLPE